MATRTLLKLLLFACASLLLGTDVNAKHRRKERSAASNEGSEDIYGHRRSLVFFDPEVFGTKSPETKPSIDQQRDEILDSPLEAPKDTSADKKSMLSEKVRNVSHRRFLNEVPGQDINKYLEEDDDDDDEDFLERRKQSGVNLDNDDDVFGDKPMSSIDESVSAIRRAAFDIIISNSTNKYPRLGEKVSSKLLAEKLKELLASNKSRESIKEIDLNEQADEIPPNSNFKQIMKKLLEKNIDKLKKKRLRRPVCRLDTSIKRFVDDFEKKIDRGSLKVLPNRYNDNFYIPLRYYNYLAKLKARFSEGSKVKFEFRDE